MVDSHDLIIPEPRGQFDRVPSRETADTPPPTCLHFALGLWPEMTDRTCSLVIPFLDTRLYTPLCRSPFWAAAPKGRCPVGHRGEFPYIRTSIHTSVCTSPPQCFSILKFPLNNLGKWQNANFSLNNMGKWQNTNFPLNNMERLQKIEKCIFPIQ